MKPQKLSELAPTAPFLKLFKAEPFFERVKEFQDAMVRHAYELFAPYPYTTGRELENWVRTETEYLPVPLEVTETEEAFVIRAELPGFKENEIEVRVEPGRLFIGGKREEVTEQKKGKTVYSDRIYSQTARWFELPTEIDPEKVKATLNKGVLEITLQKAQLAKKIPIEIKAA